jgi:hypothetical protein
MILSGSLLAGARAGAEESRATGSGSLSELPERSR